MEDEKVFLAGFVVYYCRKCKYRKTNNRIKTNNHKTYYHEKEKIAESVY